MALVHNRRLDMLDGPTRDSQFHANEHDQRFDLREGVSFVWRHWKFALLVTSVVVLVGMVFLLQQTPLYTATSQVLLDPQRTKPPGGDAVMSEAPLDIAMLESQIAIIQSTVLLRRVVDREHLADRTVDEEAASHSARIRIPFLDEVLSFVGTLGGNPESGKAAPPAPAEPLVTPGSEAIPENELSAIGALKGSLKVSRVAQQGYLLGISVTTPDPVRSARLANAVADAYLVDKLDTRFEAAKRASSWLGDRLQKLRLQVQESEEMVADFRAEHGLIQSGGVTLNQQQLSDLNSKLIDAKADLAQRKSSVDLLNAIQAKGGSLQDVPDIANGGSLPVLRQQLANLSAQEADLLARYGANHPLVVNIRAQMRDVEHSATSETQRLAASLKNGYELAQARVASLEKSLQAATGQYNIDDATGIRLRELERIAAANKTLFEDFLKQAKITQEQSTFETQDVRVITPATPPGAPSYPRKLRFMMINIVVGLLVGVGGALAKEKLNSGFTTPKQVEDLLGLPLLASVSHLGGRDLTAGPGIHEHPTVRPLSRYSEAIRSLRSAVHMTDVDNPPKVIQVTSAVPGEGKTTIALSLASSAATAKLKVLFIDADLRRPSATSIFGLQNERGLVDLLLGQANVEDVVRFNPKGGYWTLGAGDKSPSPTDLLSSERMKTIVAGFRQAYDLVIIDTPPAVPVVDPAVVSHLTDKIIFVVRWGATARELVRDCVNQLSRQRKIAGIAFNQVYDRKARKYGKHAYSYYYVSRYKNYYGT